MIITNSIQNRWFYGFLWGVRMKCIYGVRVCGRRRERERESRKLAHIMNSTHFIHKIYFNCGAAVCALCIQMRNHKKTSNSSSKTQNERNEKKKGKTKRSMLSFSLSLSFSGFICVFNGSLRCVYLFNLFVYCPQNANGQASESAPGRARLHRTGHRRRSRMKDENEDVKRMCVRFSGRDLVKLLHIIIFSVVLRFFFFSYLFLFCLFLVRFVCVEDLRLCRYYFFSGPKLWSEPRWIFLGFWR